MKRFLTTIVAVVLMLSLCVGCVAEGKPYIRQLGFGSTTYTLMTTESYPMVRIGLDSYLSVYHYYNQGADEAVVFPCPEGYYAAKFDMNSAKFTNPDQELDIWYSGNKKSAYETFLLDAPSADCILSDGAKGYAAYIDPSRGYAYALIGLDTLRKGAKLKITINDGRISKKNDKQRVETLTALINDEIQRVLKDATYEKNDVYWTRNAFNGIDLVSSWFSDLTARVTLPERAVIAGQPGAVWEITQVDHDTFTLNAIFAREKNNVKYAELTFKLGTYSYVDSLVKKGTTPEKFVVNGMEYWAVMHESGKFAYLDCLLANNGGYSANENYYLYIEAKLDGLKWMSSQLMINDLTKLLEGIEYIYAEKPWYSDYAPYSAYVAPATATPTPVVTATPTPVVTPTPTPAVTCGVTVTPAPEAPKNNTQAGEFSFRNGLHWGMSSAEVLAAEGQSRYLDEGRFNDHAVMKVLRTTLSSFNVYGRYFFVDDQLEGVEFYLRDTNNTSANVEYLANALTQVYGTPEKDAPILHQLSILVEQQGQDMETYKTSEYFWGLGNGTCIQLYDCGDYMDLFYMNAPFSIDDIFAEPTPVPYNLNGL